MIDDIRLHDLQGDAMHPWLDVLGDLRIRVFREFPYLYDGTLEYEREYLKRYMTARDALVVMVTDGHGDAVGATTCLPLAEECEEFQQPFIQSGADIGKIFYFGESLLLPDWRGRGIGKLFFDHRESHAHQLGYETTTFCAVDRPENHPLRPMHYRPLDAFWASRGYVKQVGMQARFAWREVGKEEESDQTLTFWVR